MPGRSCWCAVHTGASVGGPHPTNTDLKAGQCAVHPEVEDLDKRVDHHVACSHRHAASHDGCSVGRQVRHRPGVCREHGRWRQGPRIQHGDLTAALTGAGGGAASRRVNRLGSQRGGPARNALAGWASSGWEGCPMAPMGGPPTRPVRPAATMCRGVAAINVGWRLSLPYESARIGSTDEICVMQRSWRPRKCWS